MTLKKTDPTQTSSWKSLKSHFNEIKDVEMKEDEGKDGTDDMIYYVAECVATEEEHNMVAGLAMDEEDFMEIYSFEDDFGIPKQPPEDQEENEEDYGGSVKGV